jgi:AcrR family transcriptional regulator
MKFKQQMSSKSAMSSPPVPLSDCEVTDPRVRRTRQLLQGAMRTLLSQKSFDEISVRDITDAATVNRATFYDHYTDKFRLLEAWVASGFHQLLAERNVKFDGTCSAAASGLIRATCDFLVQARGDEKTCARQTSFEPLMDAAVIAAIRRVLKQGVASDLRAAAASWAIYGAAKQWYQSPRRPPVEKSVLEILRWVLPILDSGRGASLH